MQSFVIKKRRWIAVMMIRSTKSSSVKFKISQGSVLLTIHSFQTLKIGDPIYEVVVHVIILVLYASIGHATLRHGVQVFCRC